MLEERIRLCTYVAWPSGMWCFRRRSAEGPDDGTSSKRATETVRHGGLGATFADETQSANNRPIILLPSDFRGLNSHCFALLASSYESAGLGGADNEHSHTPLHQLSIPKPPNAQATLYPAFTTPDRLTDLSTVAYALVLSSQKNAVLCMHPLSHRPCTPMVYTESGILLSNTPR